MTYSPNNLNPFYQCVSTVLLHTSSCVIHFWIVAKVKNWIYQSGFQSEPETAPLAAVIAGYCHFLSPVQARSSTCIDISKKVIPKVFQFYKSLTLILFYKQLAILLHPWRIKSPRVCCLKSLLNILLKFLYFLPISVTTSWFC